MFYSVDSPAVYRGVSHVVCVGESALDLNSCPIDSYGILVRAGTERLNNLSASTMRLLFAL
jgi:hypothetical protein